MFQVTAQSPDLMRRPPGRHCGGAGAAATVSYPTIWGYSPWTDQNGTPIEILPDDMGVLSGHYNAKAEFSNLTRPYGGTLSCNCSNDNIFLPDCQRLDKLGGGGLQWGRCGASPGRGREWRVKRGVQVEILRVFGFRGDGGTDCRCQCKILSLRIAAPYNLYHNSTLQTLHSII